MAFELSLSQAQLDCLGYFDRGQAGDSDMRYALKREGQL